MSVRAADAIVAIKRVVLRIDLSDIVRYKDCVQLNQAEEIDRRNEGDGLKEINNNNTEKNERV